MAAYMRHLRHGEPIDEACRKAHNADRSVKRGGFPKPCSGCGRQMRPKCANKDDPRWDGLVQHKGDGLCEDCTTRPPCGTMRAFARHRYYGEPIDEACRKARNADRRAKYVPVTPAPSAQTVMCCDCGEKPARPKHPRCSACHRRWRGYARRLCPGCGRPFLYANELPLFEKSAYVKRSGDVPTRCVECVTGVPEEVDPMTATLRRELEAFLSVRRAHGVPEAGTDTPARRRANIALGERLDRVG